jgi:hypothetical protein
MTFMMHGIGVWSVGYRRLRPHTACHLEYLLAASLSDHFGSDSTIFLYSLARMNFLLFTPFFAPQ